MKIKFIKDYVSVDPATNSGIIHRLGETEEIKGYTAQWLIDNGFAEKVEERWPILGDIYWCVLGDGTVILNEWLDSSFDNGAMPIGNVFKTEKLAQRFVDYLKAIETVRHDEGFMKISRKIDYNSYGYAISKSYWNKSLVAEVKDSEVKAGEFYFDTAEHARDSLEAHRSEWKTIIDYDWSRE